ncbi:hypothetical protein [Fodinibius salsisoli]|uniref:Uncharacterized protein n=1 Tax=Fodinibius salsisoli TaxID=2820877 RepID=A0ABT3PIN2_9BACT|nr:hypothetical protein [Fodinibius salsisoli]MCW9705798.1 hypothetical protein [Fodinibius salsisoli]
MNEIILIGTAHKERGICNSNELYRIIEQISPEIIFEELSSNGFTAIYEGSRTDTLETKTIKRYVQKYPLTHFPVDLDGNEFVNIRFKNDIDKMFDIFYHNQEYRYLSSQHEKCSERFGFPYLNSIQCIELLGRTHSLEADILRIMNHRKLSQIYNDWLYIHDKREKEMINNIYSYSNQEKYSKALFLIGAEHRKSIIDKIPFFEKNNKLVLNWNFNYFD